MYKVIIKGDYDRLAELVKRYPGISRDVRRAKITEAVMLFEAAVKRETPYGAGPIHLRDSIHSGVKVSGQKVFGSVGTPLEHGEPVEYGTRPHFPPIAPLTHWVQTVLRVDDEKEAGRIAFLIARKIAKRGTKGSRMFERVLADNEAAVRRIMDEIPAEIVRRAEGVRA